MTILRNNDYVNNIREQWSLFSFLVREAWGRKKKKRKEEERGSIKRKKKKDDEGTSGGSGDLD